MDASRVFYCPEMSKSILLLLALASGAFAQTSYHIQIYDLPATAETLPDPKVWTLGYVDGISVRHKWKDLEPNQGQYNWSLFDQAVALAKANNKKVELRVAIQGSNTPTWVQTPTNMFTPPDGSSPIWKYWDPTALSAVEAMYQAMGARYGANPVVSIVSVSIDSQETGDWSCPHTTPDINAWIAAGYTTQLNEQSALSLIDTLAKAFPNSVVYMACGRNGNLDPTLNTVAEFVAAVAYERYPGRFRIGKNGWSDFNPTCDYTALGTDWEVMLDFWSYDESVQALWPNYGDPYYYDNQGVAASYYSILRAMIQEAQGWGFISAEVYESDVLNLPNVFLNYN